MNIICPKCKKQVDDNKLYINMNKRIVELTTTCHGRTAQAAIGFDSLVQLKPGAPLEFFARYVADGLLDSPEKAPVKAAVVQEILKNKAPIKMFKLEKIKRKVDL